MRAALSSAPTRIFSSLDDLGDDLEIFSSPASSAPDVEEFRPTYIETCRKCGGSGVYNLPSSHGRACFACKGVGHFVRMTSPEARQKAKASREARKAKTADDSWSAFVEDHPVAAAWIDGAGDFPFAVSMREAVRKWGTLTDRQLQACENAAAKRAAYLERKAAENVERAAREASAPEITIDKVAQAFASAKSSGIKRPKLRLAGFLFSPAPESGRNAGAIYVKQGETYLGKVVAGKFVASRDCSDTSREEILAACADPFAAAKAYGLRTGVCSCCGRELTKGESIERGIGPICAEKFGW